MVVNAQSHVSSADSRVLVTRLRRSQVYRDYERAFRDTTGLPIALRPIEAFDLPHHGDPQENPFCAVMAQSNHSCSACLQLQKRVEEEARLEPKTLKCFAGLCDSECCPYGDVELRRQCRHPPRHCSECSLVDLP